MHVVFHISWLKPTIGFVPGLSGVTLSAFQPPVDDSGEFRVEDILDSRLVHHSCLLVEKFLVKWHGNDLLKATWQPLANLTDWPYVLSLFC